MANLKVLFLAVVLGIGIAGADIQGVMLLFRHGERTPEHLSPNFGRTAMSDEIGLGQLTLTGSRQLYNVGVDLRSRYLSLFDKSGYYRLSNMHVMSSPYPRCIVSLSSFMAGFMPPPANDKTIPFRWQAFPFTVDNGHSWLIVDGAGCPAFGNLYADLMAGKSDPVYDAWWNQNKAVIDRVATFVGEPLNDMMTLFMVTDLIRTNQYLQPPPPEWLMKDYENTLSPFLYKHLFNMMGGSDTTKRLSAGNMITQTVTNMMALRNGTADAKKMIIYSAHDGTISALSKVLDVASQIPDVALYGDTIAVELHKTKAQFEVQVWYMSNTAKKPYKTNLTIPGCGKSCPLDTFNSLMQKWFIFDWKTACAV